MSQHLADYYNNPDLQEQARQTLVYVREFLGLHDIPVSSRIVDLGCGMGSLATGLAQSGWTEGVGVDYAPQMLEAARQLAGETPVRFETGNILTWTSNPPAAIITCFDVLNHVLEPAEVQALFAHVGGQLTPGGYFLLDVNTRENFASPIWNYQNRELATESYRMCLNGWFDEATGRVYAQTRVTMETPEGPQTQDNTLSCQYHNEVDLMTWLKNAGFSVIQSFGYSPMDLSQVIPDLKYTKTRFECRKTL